MGRQRVVAALCTVVALILIVGGTPVRAAETYKLALEQVEKQKAFFDDPRPYRNVLTMKKIMPPDVYAQLSGNEDEMKRIWADTVGFKSTDVVGKLHPEIVPGKYTYKDKDRLPFKDLMLPQHYFRFAPQAPPHAANFSEITVVPTRQWYYHPRIAEASKNAGSKQDAQGYLIPASFKGGFPFPKPSGPNKAIQVVYNWRMRCMGGDSQHGLQFGKGFNKNMTIDFDTLNDFFTIRLQGRAYMEPYGWLDERAQKNLEQRAFYFGQLAPRDLYGNVVSITNYLDPDKFDLFFLYVNSLRRLRRLSATDAQDAAVGQDIIFEDFEGFNQQLTPKRYPYKFRIIAEREYLIPAIPPDGSSYFTKAGEMKGMHFERRPVYVIEMLQQDSNFIYSKRIAYFDREHFGLLMIENYDQKGRLYRTTENIYYLYTDLGLTTVELHNQRDYIDNHSFISRVFIYPAAWAGRDQISLKGLAKGSAK